MSDGKSAPIDEGAEDSAVEEMWKHGFHPLLIKIEELGIADFSRSHPEFPMLAPGHLPPDRNLEGFICEDDARDICSHQPSDDGGIGGVSADHKMGLKQEQIT
jgi:hypothetical protein